MQTDPIVIVGAARTPIGGFMGAFASLTASELGGVAIKAAVQRSGVPVEQIEELIFGNCLLAGQGQAPARQASIRAGLAACHQLHHGLQDVWIGDESDHACARCHRRR